MNRKDLVDKIYKKLNGKISKTDTNLVLTTMLTEIRISVKSGNFVMLKGFGTLLKTRLKARNGRNPRTGEALKIPAKNVVRFRPAGIWAATLNRKRV